MDILLHGVDLSHGKTIYYWKDYDKICWIVMVFYDKQILTLL